MQIHLEIQQFRSDSFVVKTLSIEEAKGRFQAVCEEALAGEVIRFRTADGSLLELTPVPPNQPKLTEAELSQCYEDNEWAVFENRCGAASD